MENQELLRELADARKRIAGYEEEKRLRMIAQIKKFGDKYTDKELENKDLSTLEIIADAFGHFKGLEEPETMMDEGIKPKQKSVDLSTVFDDISKDFNMTKIHSRVE